jgi:hypothetical protein
LNSMRRLADTTAESETSVKRTYSIGSFVVHASSERGGGNVNAEHFVRNAG